MLIGKKQTYNFLNKMQILIALSHKQRVFVKPKHSSLSLTHANTHTHTISMIKDQSLSLKVEKMSKEQNKLPLIPNLWELTAQF